MTKSYEMIGEVNEIRPLTNSYSGNPRWEIQFYSGGPDHRLNHTVNTSADASFNYEIGNVGYRVGDYVRFTIGGRGTITGVEASTRAEWLAADWANA